MAKPTIRLERPAKTQISLRIRAVWSESSLIEDAFYNLQVIQRGIKENPCRTGWMYGLIWVFACYTGLIVGFVMRWLILWLILCPWYFLVKTPWQLKHLDSCSSPSMNKFKINCYNKIIRNDRKRIFRNVRTSKIQIGLRIRAVWSESSLCVFWIANDASFFTPTTKTLIRLHGCAGWFESSLGARQKVRFLSFRLD